ncbi:MAG: ABC transporter substrate binding protein [Elusimicrobiota bacterium]
MSYAAFLRLLKAGALSPQVSSGGPGRFWMGLPRLILAALAMTLSAPAEADTLAVVMDGLKPGYQKVIRTLERDLSAGNTIRIYDIGAIDFSNPVAKGRFLSQIASADLVVPIGDPASRLISRELEDLRTFFIAAAALSGEYLGRQQVAGILSYSPEETVRVARVLLPELKVISVFYTPGYEGVVTRMKSAARGMGFAVDAHRVKSRQEVGPAIRTAAARADLFWIAGDPLLTQDLIFSYLLQESLNQKKPLAVPVPHLVEKGGLFCTVPDQDKIAQLASTTLTSFLSPGFQPSDQNRVQPAPREGYVLINRRLAEKWDIDIPPSLRLWEGLSD